jgi:anti-sigma B factor antagonist
MTGLARISVRTEFDRSESGRPRRVVVVVGDLDVGTSPHLRGEIMAGLPAPEDELVVDMAGVAFIDASGIGVLIGAANEARSAGATLVLRAPSPAVTWVLDILGLDSTLCPTTPGHRWAQMGTEPPA